MQKVKILFCGLVGIALTACTTLALYKERKEGNVVQVHSIKHVKSGRVLTDAATVSTTNAGVITRQVGGSAGASIAAGGVALALDAIVNSASDNDEYYVSVTRPDDLVPNLLSGPAKPRINTLGAVKLVSVNDLHAGDWVKVVKVGANWTLVPCKLPESGCQDKLDQMK